MKTTRTFNRRAMAGLVAAAFPHVALAASVQTTSARFEVILPGYAPDKAVTATHKAYSGILSSALKSVRFLPNPLPAQPGAPQSQARYAGGVSIPDMNCDNAFAEITYNPKATSNAVLGGGSGETYRGCLYAFQKGFKLYGLVTTYEVSTDGLSASIISGLGKLVQGDQTTNVERWTTRLIDKLREQAPDMLVARIEVPGKALQEPDAAAVASLIPPAEAAPAAPAQVAAQAPTTSQDAQLEARKSLTSMGLIYHDSAQFFSAIRRKDELAVKLFVAGGGVEINAAGPTGETPLAAAKATGSASLVALLEGSGKPAQAQAAAPLPATTPSYLTPDAQAMQAKMREMIQRQQMFMQSR